MKTGKCLPGTARGDFSTFCAPKSGGVNRLELLFSN